MREKKSGKTNKHITKQPLYGEWCDIINDDPRNRSLKRSQNENV